MLSLAAGLCEAGMVNVFPNTPKGKRVGNALTFNLYPSRSGADSRHPE